jgi:hypothetical protein
VVCDFCWIFSVSVDGFLYCFEQFNTKIVLNTFSFYINAELIFCGVFYDSQKKRSQKYSCPIPINILQNNYTVSILRCYVQTIYQIFSKYLSRFSFQIKVSILHRCLYYQHSAVLSNFIETKVSNVQCTAAQPTPASPRSPRYLLTLNNSRFLLNKISNVKLQGIPYELTQLTQVTWNTWYKYCSLST